MFNSLVQVFYVFEGNCPSVASVTSFAPACPTPLAQWPKHREAPLSQPVLPAPDRASVSLPFFCLEASSVSCGRDSDVQTGRPRGGVSPHSLAVWVVISARDSQHAGAENGGWAPELAHDVRRPLALKRSSPEMFQATRERNR